MVFGIVAYVLLIMTTVSYVQAIISTKSDMLCGSRLPAHNNAHLRLGGTDYSSKNYLKYQQGINIDT